MPVARNIGEVGNVQGPEAWLQSLPIVTRYWFGTALVITLAVNFGIVNVTQIVFYWHAIQTKLELWRLLVPFLYIGGFQFNTLIALMILVQFSERYEKGGPINTGGGGGTADYVFMHMIMMVLTLVTYPLTNMVFSIPPIFARNMIYGVLYVWSKRNPTSQANIWGIPIPAMYLPFAYVALTVFLGGAYMDMLHGMAMGHIYYFLADVVPQVQGRDILQTPQFLIDYFGVGEYRPVAEPQNNNNNNNNFGGGSSGFGPQQRAGAATNNNTGGGHNWGQGGRALGRQ